MNIVFLLCALFLIGVFAVAGVAKLVDRSGSRKAMTDFGLPVSLAGPLSLLLPIAEITIASLLVPATTTWWSSLGALGFLLIFSVGIGVNLARGNKPACHCFGQLRSAPVSWATLLRNALFTACAAILVWRGSPESNAHISGLLESLTETQKVALFFSAGLACTLTAVG